MDEAVLARRRALGAAIRGARGGVSQAHLAAQLGIRQPALSGWEHGRVGLDLDKVLTIEMALGLAPGILSGLGGYSAGGAVPGAGTATSDPLAVTGPAPDGSAGEVRACRSSR